MERRDSPEPKPRKGARPSPASELEAQAADAPPTGSLRPRAHPVIWPALLGVPLLALAYLTVVYAVAPWSCAHQRGGALHVVSVLALVIGVVIVASAMAARRRTWAALPDEPPGSSSSRANPRFLAVVGAWIAAYFCLVMLAIWIPQWMLPACVS